MKQSENVAELIEALTKAKLSFSKAKKSGKNNAFSKTGTAYSTIDDILEACNAPLANNGIVVIQDPEFVDGRLVLTTRIYHKSGQWIESLLSFKPSQDTAQAIASAITYSKRYALVALLGISCGEEDDDGNESSKNADPKLPKPTVESLMTKYIASFKTDRTDERLQKIYTSAKTFPNIDNAEAFIKAKFEELYGQEAKTS